MIEKNIDKKLANRISYQIWWGGPNLQKGSISTNGFGTNF